MTDTDLTFIQGEQTSALDATLEDGSARLAPADLAACTGWELKPEGLCRGAICIPGALTPGLVVGGRIDLAAFAAATGNLLVVDTHQRIAAVGPGSAERGRAMRSLQAPDFRAPTVQGEELELADLRGRKKLLVAFASW